MFRAWYAEKKGDAPRLTELDEASLPSEVVRVRVHYSALNYKDGLAFTGKAPVMRRFPMVPGVEFSGIVEESASPEFLVGDRVMLNGWGIGETHWGSFSELAQVKPEWLLHVPEELDLKTAMALGTGGLTAMLCLLKLEQHGVPKGADVLVTGAGGGVGSLALLVAAQAGYRVIAASGRPELEPLLRSLGASEIIGRQEVVGVQGALGKEKWAGAIDVVGGETLAGVLRCTAYGGCVAACGLAQSGDLPTSVYPFILRGVTLAGVDMVMCPNSVRGEAWKRLASLDLKPYEPLVSEAPLEDLPKLGEMIIAGQTRGRVVIRISR